MNNYLKLGLGGLVLLGVAAIGYWSGSNSRIEGRGWGIEKQGASSAVKVERKVLYYRNPMGLADTSPLPKKDAMGMDYVAVYQGEISNESVVNISVDKVQKLGVKSEAVTWRELNDVLRVTGRIEIDERHSYTIAPKFEGWVNKLYVNSTGQSVSKDQPLFEVYSPELVSAQREHALATQGLNALQSADDDAQASMRRLAAASAARLKNWDVAVQGNDTSRVIFRAPVSGIVLEKKAVQGMRFMSGEVLYRIADLSSVWVIAEVAEQDIARVRSGSRVSVAVDAFPERHFDGKVDFIYPTLNAATRTVPLRIVLANPGGELKPAMFAKVQITADRHEQVLTVPGSAVIDSGSRQVVLVRLSEGRFEPRTVRLGRRNDDYVEVLSGVAADEQVVISANFLIDAESNLKAVLGSMTMPEKSSASIAVSEQGQAGSVAHQAHGTLNAINADGTVSITHQAIKSLGWPGMTMDFALANSGLVNGIATGSSITFEIVERGKDEWVITRLQVQHGGH